MVTSHAGSHEASVDTFEARTGNGKAKQIHRVIDSLLVPILKQPLELLHCRQKTYHSQKSTADRKPGNCQVDVSSLRYQVAVRKNFSIQFHDFKIEESAPKLVTSPSRAS